MWQDPTGLSISPALFAIMQPHMQDFSRGVVEGIVNFGQGIWQAATNPTDTLTHLAHDAAVHIHRLNHDPTYMAERMLFRPSSPQYYAREMFRAHQNDGVRGMGQQYGNQLGQAGMVLAFHGVCKLTGSI